MIEVHKFARLFWIALLLIALHCAPPSGPRYTPAAKHALNLPESREALIQLADELSEKDKADLASLTRARAALDRALESDPKAFETRWRLARVCFRLGQRFQHQGQRAEIAEQGIEHARVAIGIADARVEGHYFLALNMGNLADARAKLSLVKPMLAAGERASEIDPQYDRAGALLFAGKVYLTAPAWPISVGNVEKAIERLERALEIAPRPITRVFLGQAYFEDDEPEQAKAQLEHALANPGDLEQRWRDEAKRTLERISD